MKFIVYNQIFIHLNGYDIGNKLEFLKATVEFGLRHADGGEKFLNYLKERLAQEN